MKRASFRVVGKDLSGSEVGKRDHSRNSELSGPHHGIHAAIDEEYAAMNETGLDRLQKGDSIGDLLGRARAAQGRDEVLDRLAEPGIVLGGLVQGRFHCAGGGHVGA